MPKKLNKPRVYGRVRHSSKGVNTWIELSKDGVSVRGFHCHKTRVVALQEIVDLTVGQFPLAL